MNYDIVIHTKSDCPWCVKAKDWLTAKNLPFTAIVHDDVEDRNAMYDSLGLKDSQRTVPQIIVGGKRIGGYSDLIASDLFSVSFDEDF